MSAMSTMLAIMFTSISSNIFTSMSATLFIYMSATKSNSMLATMSATMSASTLCEGSETMSKYYQPSYGLTGVRAAMLEMLAHPKMPFQISNHSPFYTSSIPRIDKFFLISFPILFFIFNIIYWLAFIL